MLITAAHSPAMIRIVIQWQHQCGRWQRFQEKHNQADENGQLLDLLEP